MKPAYKRFTVKNSDRIELLAKIYFQFNVLHIPRNEIAEELKIPITTIGSYFSQHINKLVNNPNDVRYSMFYSSVKKIAEQENQAIDLVPPTTDTSRKIEVKHKCVEPKLSLLLQRKELDAKLAELNEAIYLQAEFILNTMFTTLEALHERITLLVDALTVKQYRTGNYPEHFIHKMSTVSTRISEINEQFGLFVDSDLQTETSKLRKIEVEDLLRSVKENVSQLRLN